MTVQLTRLRDAWVLAVCCSHACFDGHGFFSMMQDWARATRGEAIDRPSFERPAPTPARPRGAVRASLVDAGWHRVRWFDGLRYLLALPRMHARRYVTRFDSEAIQSLKAELARATGCEGLSSNTALVAHVARHLVELVGLPASASYALSSTIDLRDRVPGFDASFKGNAVALAVESGIPVEASVADLAGRFHRRLAPLTERPSPELTAASRLAWEAAEHALPYAAFRLRDMLGARPRLLYTNSFARFPIYALDFGPTEPVTPLRAIPHNLADPIVLWPAPPSEGGVELYVGGAFARALRRRGEDDSWWRSLDLA